MKISDYWTQINSKGKCDVPLVEDFVTTNSEETNALWIELVGGKLAVSDRNGHTTYDMGNSHVEVVVAEWMSKNGTADMIAFPAMTPIAPKPTKEELRAFVKEKGIDRWAQSFKTTGSVYIRTLNRRLTPTLDIPNPVVTENIVCEDFYVGDRKHRIEHFRFNIFDLFDMAST